jgi:hypothetical protein
VSALLSIRGKLVGSLAVVSLCFVLALVVGWIAIGGVMRSTRDGCSEAVAATAASADAFNMRVSQAQNAADGGRERAMHRSDIAQFTRSYGTLHRLTAADAHDRAMVDRIGRAFLRPQPPAWSSSSAGSRWPEPTPAAV